MTDYGWLGVGAPGVGAPAGCVPCDFGGPMAPGGTSRFRTASGGGLGPSVCPLVPRQMKKAATAIRTTTRMAANAGDTCLRITR